MTTKRSVIVDGTLGTLVNDKYVYFPVKLDLQVRELYDNGQLVDSTVFQHRMISCNVPDGPNYTLRYEYQGKREEFIGLRVQLGHLLASS